MRGQHSDTGLNHHYPFSLPPHGGARFDLHQVAGQASPVALNVTGGLYDAGRPPPRS
ncbi:hypothetical protein PSEUDO8AS_60093 [Pseudomonas sp. 8AS]|nr:hypothetical protein PSEUDO8AS_60093 [Pseudomonas sp. 8AS]